MPTAASPRASPTGTGSASSTTAGQSRAFDTGESAGPLEIEAVLWYQPIGYRWAENLRPYDAPEPARFVGYYSAMSSASAVVVARGMATTD